MKNKNKTKEKLMNELVEFRKRTAELEKSKTEYKQVEKRQKLMGQVLELLNQSRGKIDTIRNILLMVKKYGRFEAVGIRLREGEDFPYYETNGFPEYFVEAEKYLCARNHAQKLIRDSEGNPILECMCGNIICGRTDPSLPFFTESGSFWSNCTTELLASTSEEERQARTRDRCNGEGYESVALIPLHSDGEIIGLLQLNDRRKNMFTLEMIRYFEEIGASVGIALARKQAEEGLSKHRDHLKELVEERTAELQKELTERKKAEEKIKASLKEKEVLLQEVHHRVKNNMQIISSLFHLQSKHIKDKQMLEIYKSSQERIKSMALVHERLYQSKDFAEVDFSEYIRSLSRRLLIIYEIDPKVIKLDLNIKNIFLGVDTAVPCGLIVNELISNSLRHGFPDGKKGEIKIVMRLLNEDEIELTVSDNGIGIPKEVDFRKTESLGLHLLTLLAEQQLHGDIKLDRAKGTNFRIRFKVKK